MLYTLYTTYSSSSIFSITLTIFNLSRSSISRVSYTHIGGSPFIFRHFSFRTSETLVYSRRFQSSWYTIGNFLRNFITSLSIQPSIIFRTRFTFSSIIFPFIFITSSYSTRISYTFFSIGFIVVIFFTRGTLNILSIFLIISTISYSIGVTCTSLSIQIKSFSTNLTFESTSIFVIINTILYSSIFT